MPSRIIREGILSSERIDSLAAEEEVFYRRLLNVVDDFGRFDARSAILIAACYPLRAGRMLPEHVERMLRKCAAGANPLIRLYSVHGKPFLEVQDFRQQMRAKKSKYPSPCEADAQQVLSTCEAEAQHMHTYSESETESDSIPSSHDEGSTSNHLKLIDDPPFDPTPEPGKNPAWGEPEPQTEVNCNRKPSQPTRAEVEAWFLTVFWPVYPRKVDKQTALKWCLKHAAQCEKRTQIMDGLRRDLPQMREAARNGEKTFIPYPSTYLSKCRWKPDEGDADATPPDATRLMM